MENKCDIVEDLLFGYADKTLTKTSKEFVEEHIKTCEKCKSTLKEIEKEGENEEQEIEIDYLKEINKKEKKKTILITIVSIFLISILIFNVLVFANYNMAKGEMQVFLKYEISSEEKEELETIIKSQGKDIEFKYNSAEEELEKMKQNLGDKLDLLNNYNNENNIFPASYKIIASKDEINKIESKIRNLDYIKQINSNTKLNPYEMFWINIMN